MVEKWLLVLDGIECIKLTRVLTTTKTHKVHEPRGIGLAKNNYQPRTVVLITMVI